MRTIHIRNREGSAADADEAARAERQPYRGHGQFFSISSSISNPHRGLCGWHNLAHLFGGKFSMHALERTGVQKYFLTKLTPRLSSHWFFMNFSGLIPACSGKFRPENFSDRESSARKFINSLDRIREGGVETPRPKTQNINRPRSSSVVLD
jgi:hypothetical protein